MGGVILKLLCVLILIIFFSTGTNGCSLQYNGTRKTDQIVLERDNTRQPCVAQGYFNDPTNWHGYLVKAKLLPQNGRIYYHIRYPENKCCIKLLLYLYGQVKELRAKTMSCLQRQAVLDPRGKQVISLSPHVAGSGCTRNVTVDGEKYIDCSSGLVLKSDRERLWNVAVSSCGSPTGLDFQYSLVIYGYVGECELGVNDSSRNDALAVFRSRSLLFIVASSSMILCLR